MSDDIGAQFIAPDVVVVRREVGSILCAPTADGHCITCADEALPATVMHVDEETGLALVTVQEMTEEIDITLVDSVAPGDLLLVHGGVAIGKL